MEEFSEYAKGILNKDNVGIVAKFLKNLPAPINFNFNSSKFYTSWLLNSFFNVSENFYGIIIDFNELENIILKFLINLSN